MTTSPKQIFAVDSAIRSRHSIRRFLSTPVEKPVLTELLELASWAPSGANAQPWKVYALAGAHKDQLSQAVIDKFMQSGAETSDYTYYPSQWMEPWRSRRRKSGVALYGLLDIAKGDQERMMLQEARNYQFFDAPVGLILTMDRSLGIGMLMDYGFFLGNLLTAARVRGLDTCVQGAFADFPETIRKTLQIPDNELIVCGVSLGYADPDAPENQLITERAPVEEFTDFRGF